MSETQQMVKAWVITITPLLIPVLSHFADVNLLAGVSCCE